MMLRGLTTLALLIASIAAQTAAQTPTTARAVLQQFLKLDTEGGQLTTEGWKQVAGLFTTATKPSMGTIVLVRDCGISAVTMVGDKPGAYIECIRLGELDTSTWRFSKLEIKQRRVFDVVSNSEGWRIVGSPPEPHVSVAAAIRFVQERRNQIADPLLRKNADALLRSFRTLAP
jgi:hypothetical protein